MQNLILHGRSMRPLQNLKNFKKFKLLQFLGVFSDTIARNI